MSESKRDAHEHLRFLVRRLTMYLLKRPTGRRMPTRQRWNPWRSQISWPLVLKRISQVQGLKLVRSTAWTMESETRIVTTAKGLWDISISIESRAIGVHV